MFCQRYPGSGGEKERPIPVNAVWRCHEALVEREMCNFSSSNQTQQRVRNVRLSRNVSIVEEKRQREQKKESKWNISHFAGHKF